MNFKKHNLKANDVKELWDAWWWEEFKKLQKTNPKTTFQELFFHSAMKKYTKDTVLWYYISYEFEGKARSFSNLIAKILWIAETDKKDPIKLEIAILTALWETVRKVDAILTIPDVENPTTEEITYLWNHTNWPEKILEIMRNEKSGFKSAIYLSIWSITVKNEDDNKKLEKLKTLSNNVRNSDNIIFNKLVELFWTWELIADIITALFNDSKKSSSFIAKVANLGTGVRNSLVASSEYARTKF